MTGRGLSTATVAAALAREWGVAIEAIDPHHCGMNSQTWFVRAEGQRFVAKAVPADRRVPFGAGLATAALVEASGRRTRRAQVRLGYPVPITESTSSW